MFLTTITPREGAKGNTMPLIELIVILAVVGVLLWLLNTYIPMDAVVKRIINIVVIIALVLWLLKAFGLFDSISSVTV